MAETNASISLMELDGRKLYYAYMAGAKKIIEHQSDLNKINVFPVNDGDTGSNLAGTVRAVIESLQPHRSFKITADRIARSSILNARGNSGIIFAQFFYGLSMETGDIKAVTLKQFAESIKKTVGYVYEAVARPVEGTMLTVIRDLADFVYGSWHKFTDFNQLVVSAYDVVTRSLLETREKLAILEKNNVVDAGAKGFALFFEGIRDFISSGNIKELITSRSLVVPVSKDEYLVTENITYRYCTEAIIRDSNINRNEFIELLGNFGDSVVVAGSDDFIRLHIHTDNPAQLFETLRRKGRITFQKADDMIRHNQIVTNRKWKIALVTDSACDLSPEIYDRYQINMVPININFGEVQYLDKVTIQPDQFYNLLKEPGPYPKTAQVNENTFTNLFSHLSSHYDSIIAVHLSDRLSGTYFNSFKAAQKISREFNKPVSVINSRNLSGSLGLIVLRIARSIEAGYTHDQIVAQAETWIRNSRIFVSVRNLKYMVRGGRVSHAKGFIADILNINPIVTLDENGSGIVFGQAFGQKANMNKVIEHIEKLCKERNIWNYIVLHANNPEAAGWLSSRMETLTDKSPVSVVNISPVIGLNAGVGAASVALLFD